MSPAEGAREGARDEAEGARIWYSTVYCTEYSIVQYVIAYYSIAQ